MPSAARLAKSVCNEKGLQFLRPSLDSALPHCLPPITIPNCGEPVFTLDQGEDTALKPRIIVGKIREPEVTSKFPSSRGDNVPAYVCRRNADSILRSTCHPPPTE